MLFPFLMLMIVALHTITSAARSDQSLQAEAARAALAAALCCDNVVEAAAQARASLDLRAQYRGVSGVDCIDNPDTGDRALIEADVAFSHAFGETEGDTVFVEPPADRSRTDRARVQVVLRSGVASPGSPAAGPRSAPAGLPADEPPPRPMGVEAAWPDIARLDADAVPFAGLTGPQWTAHLVGGGTSARATDDQNAYLSGLYLQVPLGGQVHVTATCQLAATTLGGVFLGSEDIKRRSVGSAVVDPFRQRRPLLQP